MTIRTRLSLWYAGILFVSLLAMGVLMYHNFLSGSQQWGQQKRQEEESDFLEVVRILIGCGVPAALLALAGGWWLTRQALAPVAALTRAAEQINDRNLDGALPRTGNGDEFDRLTEVFNAMTARLDDSFQRIREFTLHASHELKTPLTVLHGELETALQEPGLSAGERERLLSELDEVRRLTRIVDGLTLLTKADAGQVALQPEPVNLDELVQDAFADAQILARPADVQVRLGVCEPVTLSGDRHRLRQLLLNLTDNAIKYNQPRGSVDIALRRMADGAAEFTVANTGKGIPPGLLPRVFDRFFRCDPAHNNAVEGCGLGLSIARWIVAAHGGSIRITSTPGDWTTATVRLPVKPVE